MTNRERAIAALEHRRPDRTPYAIGFTQNARRAFIESFAIEWMERRDGVPKLHDAVVERASRAPGAYSLRRWSKLKQTGAEVVWASTTLCRIQSAGPRGGRET
ncbi:MAG TPA: hypothetical protein DEP45_11325 [Armatimonadetes bacterium]|nr:hypothetical protein [Armatimonadota bacterium]